MRSSQFLRKIADLEEEWKRVIEDLPHPIYDAMTREERTCLSDLLHELINQGNGAAFQDIPEALAIWKTASARIEKRFAGKETWPHWRALWSRGTET